MGGCDMTFPISPKDGEVFEHPNGYVYEFDESISTWNKTEKSELPRVELRRTRKRPTVALKEPSPTLEVKPTMTEVIEDGIS